MTISVWFKKDKAMVMILRGDSRRYHNVTQSSLQRLTRLLRNINGSIALLHNGWTVDVERSGK